MEHKYFDPQKVKEAIQAFWKEGSLFEIRIENKINPRNSGYSGYFKNPVEAVRQLNKFNQQKSLRGCNVYITINEINEACYSRQQKDELLQVKPTTSDKDIQRYKRLFIDFDPVRPSGISSSSQELTAATELCGVVYTYLQGLGFYDPIVAMSGNGNHLQYHIDLENTPDNRELIKQCLELLAKRFNTAVVGIDTGNDNPSRICKLYGTLAQKGTDTTERPHRLSFIINQGDERINERERLVGLVEALRAEIGDDQTDFAEDFDTSKGFDLDGFMQQNGIQIYKEEQGTDSLGKPCTRYLLSECVFDSSHSNGDAKITRYSNGAISYKCHHNSCKGKRWQDVRLHFDPNAYKRKFTPRTDRTAVADSKRSIEAPEALQAVLDITKNGQIKPSMQNYQYILSMDDRYKGLLIYNQFSGQIEVDNSKAWWSKTVSGGITDHDVTEILFAIAQDFQGIENKDHLLQAVINVAHKREYHPIRQFLDGLKWDGVPRIHKLFPKYLGAEECEYTTAVTKLLLFGAIHRAMYAGCKFDTMICLMDQKQGGGKSTMARFLAIRDEWFTDNMGDINSKKELGENIAGKWIVEMGEMVATAKAKSVEQIKAQISAQYDRRREPYAKFAQDFPRQCIFIGTSNREEFLPEDKSGNRRFIPLKVYKNRAEVHPLYDEKECRQFIINCYAEAMELYRVGDDFTVLPINAQIIAETLQEESTPLDEKIGIIGQWLDSCSEEYVCTALVYDNCFVDDMGYAKGRERNKYLLRDIGQIMGMMNGWEKVSQHRFKDYGQQRAWKRKQKFVDCKQGDQIFTQ